MGGKQRIYKQRIRSTQTLKKVFRAMELIAASRIGKARDKATMGAPYEKALTQAVAAVALHGDLKHPLTSERTDTNRVAVLTVTSDRGMAGAYSSTILRETERLMNRLSDEGKEPVLFTSGRRGAAHFRFRNREIYKTWEGESDAPTEDTIMDIAKSLLELFLEKDPSKAVGEVYLVFTRFKNMVSQVPEVRQMLPLTVVDTPQADASRDGGLLVEEESAALPVYEFEPSEAAVLDALLPLYVENRNSERHVAVCSIRIGFTSAGNAHRN